MKEKLISYDDVRSLHPIFRGRWGDALIKFVFKLTGIDKVNGVYDSAKHEPDGLGFTTTLLDKQHITRAVENYDVIDRFEGRPFITVSNHPYGHIDGIIAISVVARKRRDYKMMVNWILNRIDTMTDHFIGVNPYAKDSSMAGLKSSLGGVKQCIEHVREGHPLGFFPAGGVSFQRWNHRLPTDDAWKPAVLKLIQKAKVPVIPMYISGNNSWPYRLLGLVDWRIRMLRLCHEVTNKRGKTVHIRFGEPISVEEQAQYKDIEAFGAFLRAKTYALRRND